MKDARSIVAEDARDIVAKAVKTVIGEKPYDDATAIDALTTDSLERVELMIQLEEEMDQPFSDEEIDPIKTVGELVALVEKKLLPAAA